METRAYLNSFLYLFLLRSRFKSAPSLAPFLISADGLGACFAKKTSALGGEHLVPRSAPFFSSTLPYLESGFLASSDQKRSHSSPSSSALHTHSRGTGALPQHMVIAPDLLPGALSACPSPWRMHGSAWLHLLHPFLMLFSPLPTLFPRAQASGLFSPPLTLTHHGISPNPWP